MQDLQYLQAGGGHAENAEQNKGLQAIGPRSDSRPEANEPCTLNFAQLETPGAMLWRSNFKTLGVDLIWNSTNDYF